MARVAVAQMVSSTNIQQNLVEVEQLVKKAADNAAKLVLLPENFAFMGKAEGDKLAIAEDYGQGPIQQCMMDLAKKYNIWIVAGTQPIRCQSATRVRSRSIVYDETGAQVGFYDKIHLFDVRVSETEAHKESDSVEPGDELVCIDSPVGRLGLSVCYDLRFPELYHQLNEQGAELLLVPSAFTAITGIAHWQVLLRARAIENLCYVVAANQGGEHDNGRQTYGHSMIIEPWGKIDSQAFDSQDVIFADINLQRLHQLRSQFPCTQHHVL